MYRIVPPITTGQYGPEVRNLQDVILYLLETGILNNGGANISLSELNNEREQSFFGDITTQFVELFKTQYFLQSNPNELVNTPVADAMNGFAGSQFPNDELIEVSGLITHVSGNLFPTPYSVRVEEVLFSGNVTLGTTTMDNVGAYSITVNSTSLTQEGNNFAFVAIVEVDVSEEYPSTIVYIPFTQRQVVINILLDNDLDLTSEYTSIKTKVEALIGATDIKDLTVDVDNSQAEYLAKSINENVRDVRFLIYAHKLSDKLDDLDPELFYGLIRNNLPVIAEQLLFQSLRTMKAALTNATEINIIGEYDESQIDTFVQGLKEIIITNWNTDNSGDLGKTISFRIFNSVLANTSLTNEFLAIYFNFEELDEQRSFWTYLEEEFSAYDTYIKGLKAVSVLGVSVDNNPALVTSLWGILNGDTFSGSETLDVISGDPQPELLAGLNLENWIDIITDAKSSDASNFLFPDYVEGANDTAKIEFYAARLLDNYTAMYTIYSVNRKIATDTTTPFPQLKDELGTFLENNLGTDIRALSILAIKATDNNPYDLTGISDVEAFIEEIATVQRLSALTSSYEAMAALASEGLKSAFHITTIDKAEFAETFESVLGGEDKAFDIYDAADDITTRVVGKVMGEFERVTGGPLVDATKEDEWRGDDPIGHPEIDLPPGDEIADWRALFGTLDSCTCCQCESIFSPSAYLVDTLNYLRKGNSSSWGRLLLSRRPDIPDIELSCDNTDIPLPQIDIVNELLEDLIKTGIPSARQTRAAAEYQRAMPEYVNTGNSSSDPYFKLKTAVYPWSLPYNFFKRQIDEHLAIPGIKGHEMVQRFSNKDMINSLDTVQFCINYLDMSNELKAVICTASTLSSVTSYKDLQVHYGLTVNLDAASAFRTTIPNPQKRGTTLTLSDATWTTAITDRVDVFLQLTQLNYRDLLELLDCYYINPVEEIVGDTVSRKFAILNNSSTSNITTCNTFELCISPVEIEYIPPFLDRVHRFVRFARALDWNFYDLDIALRAVASNILNEAGFKKIVQLKYLCDSLNMKVADACILFQDVEILPYRDYSQEDEHCELVDIPDQYTQIFRNEAMRLVNLNTPFPASSYPGTITFPVDADMEFFTNYLAGITKLKSNELELMLSEVYDQYPTESDITSKTIDIKLPIISYIYRQVLLMRALKLSVKEWIFYQLWITNSDYFGNTSGDAPNNTAARPLSVLSGVSPYTAVPFDTVRFVNCVRLFKDAGFSVIDLEYLLLDKPLNQVSDIKSNLALAEVLGILRTDLTKKWYPGFNSGSDDASKELLTILLNVLDEQKAQQLISITDRELDITVVYTDEEIAFMSTDMAFLLPDGADKLTHNGTPGPDYIEDIQDRYAYVYENFKAYTIHSVLKPLILSNLAKYFKIEEQSIQVLLNDIIKVTTNNGFDLLLDPAFVLSTDEVERWGTFDDQFTVTLLLQKAAILIARFGLGTLDVQYFWAKTVGDSNDPVVPDIINISLIPIRATADTIIVPGTNSDATLRLFRNLEQWMQVRAFIGPDINILFKAIEQEGDVVENMCAVFRMSMEDLDALIVLPPENGSTDIGILDIDETMYQTPISYLRIIDCLEMQHLMPASMISLYHVAQATRSAASQDSVAEVIHLVRSPYTDKQWLETIEPVSDQLRVERRDMMLKYLLAYPASGYEAYWLTSNDIYETLLVDVETMPIVQTTRILLANNSIQLFINRVLMQLEGSDGVIELSLARQWTRWRKAYRVWEANRKVFVYPENWIEPELRDDKTPLFDELEKFLRQNDVTKENVEAAYKTYLERLDQLSRLDIIGIYRETPSQDYKESIADGNIDTVHAFGRTKEHPHLYYYRKREKNVWTAWERMDLQIEGDHFIPTMWRGRLRLYWLSFIKDQEQKPVANIQTQNSMEMPAGVRWKIQLAWTEYKDKKWTAKQLGKDAIYSKYIYEEKPLNGAHVEMYSSSGAGIGKYQNRHWNEEGDVDKIKRESIIFIANKDKDGNPSFSIIERDYRVGKDAFGIFGSAAATKFAVDATFEKLKTSLDGYYEWVDSAANIYWTHIGQFIVRFNGVSVINQLDTDHVDQSIYIDYAGTPPPVKYDLQSRRAGYWPWNTDYFYHFSHHLGYAHFPDGGVKLLDGGGPAYPAHYFEEVSLKYNLFTPSKKWIVRDRHRSRFLVFPRKIPNNFSGGDHIQIPYFFYKDNLHTFFVEKVKLRYSFIVGTGSWLTPTGGDGTLSFDGGTLTGKYDPISGSGIGFDFGVGSARPDLLHPEAEVISAGSVDETIDFSSMMMSPGYRFHNFSHENVDEFLDKLYKEGLDGLLNRSFVAGITDSMNFETVYKPTANVHSGEYYPHNKVDFTYEGAYSQYNWELFFHIPMLIANRLSLNQQFDDARNWYHYVFNPTNSDGTAGYRVTKRFWNFQPFYEKLTSTETVDKVMKSAGLDAAVSAWANDPFKPHLIARTRTSAYMKNAVMKYLDNLIAWGDNLFRSDSREAINEATMLYVIALQILGRRPEQIPSRADATVQTYDNIKDVLSPFGNALVTSENVMLSSGATRHLRKEWVLKWIVSGPWIIGYYTEEKVELTLKGDIYYFCIPFNDRMLQYWDILSDRLFKIRNSQSIDGVTRELALFDPPIDPALLVKAAAAGVSLAGILGDMNAPLPSYRFNVISQKASELVNEVKSLGGQLLSALEKKDVEKISLLRSSQEMKVLDAVTDIKKKQIEESRTQWEALTIQLRSVQRRQDYYKRLIDTGLIRQESTQLEKMQANIPLGITQNVLQTIGGALGAIPQIQTTLPGASFGGQHLSAILNAGATAVGAFINNNNIISSMAGINAGFERRKQDWDLQYNLAKIETEQINKQMIAAEIRFALANKELKNHELQISNAQEMDTAMRDKYTNEELYDWMIGQISYTYFQGYKLAYDTARKAERCFRYELNLDVSDYIQYGYWDSLKKGLLAGENLAYDLKRMEVAYLDMNKRQLELTKHVSLSALDPQALIDLRSNRQCEFDIPEWLFDMDYPGQHMRRIKSVSVSIPCVAGPYTTISCKLSLVKSKYRKSPFLGGAYEEGSSDTRFNYTFGNIQSVATSGAQNDSGMFEMNFKDERYLPFEGCGAISTWSIELPAAYAQFDYNTISDLILHIKYTALDGGALKAAAKTNLDLIIENEAGDDDKGQYRLFNLKQEFSNEWHQLINSTAPSIAISNIKERFPYLVQGLSDLSVQEIRIFANVDFSASISDTSTAPPAAPTPAFVSAAGPVNGVYTYLQDDNLPGFEDTWYIRFDAVTLSNIKDCWMMVHYRNYTP